MIENARTKKDKERLYKSVRERFNQIKRKKTVYKNIRPYKEIKREDYIFCPFNRRLMITKVIIIF